MENTEEEIVVEEHKPEVVELSAGLVGRGGVAL